MKQGCVVFFVIFISLVLNAAVASATDLYWYLASSMTKPGKELVKQFNDEKHPFQVVSHLRRFRGSCSPKSAPAGKGIFIPRLQ